MKIFEECEHVYKNEIDYNIIVWFIFRENICMLQRKKKVYVYIVY
jgi:hypothetical protein